MLTHLRTSSFFFFFNDTATTEIYTLSLHDALPISTGGYPSSRVQISPDGRYFVIVASTTDRKSTRLNSSHSQISYAVFCLKKKKRPIHTRPPHPHQATNHPDGSSPPSAASPAYVMS